MEINRKKVFDKFNGHCAYCGCDLELNKFQVDHVQPMRRGDSDNDLKYWKIKRGTNDIDNLFPTCRSCNAIKSSRTPDVWKECIKDYPDMLLRDNATFRLLVRIGLITINEGFEYYYENTRIKK